MNYKIVPATVSFLLVSTASYSQAVDSGINNRSQFPAWAMDPKIYLIAFVFLMMVITIYILYRVNLHLLKVISPKAFEKNIAPDEPALVGAEKKPSFLRKMYLKMVDSVPVEHEKDVLLDHNYDGIKELDNNLPPWWIYGFYFTIAFGIAYILYYHVSGVGKLQAEEYKDQITLAAEQKEARMRASTDNVNEENVVVLTEAAAIAKGKETFAKLCVACHLADGGGQVGPNLTDEFWIHGGGIKNVFKTITYGVPTKGMISWQSQLSPKQIQQVASYILTLKGTKPLIGKEPQGDLWVEEKTVQVDSLKATSKDSSMAIVPVSTGK